MRKTKLLKCWKTLILLMSISVLPMALFAQSVVTGTVSDESGAPVIGATVKAKSTNTGSGATDVNGHFSIRVPRNEKTIVVSFIGYLSQEVALTGGSLKVTLQPSSKNLSEVVVVGFGTIKRADVTGTVVSVDAKTLQEIPASNVVDQLKGRVAGLDVVNSPTNGPIITIRGTRTINAAVGTDGPLIVLDGQPYYNSIENIDPNNIKSVEVLKGASATAIYGSRASGGVLLITTNRGRVGITQTSYDTYFGINKIEGDVKVLNGTQFAQLVSDAVQGALLQNGQTIPNTINTSAIESKALAAGVSSNYPELLLQNGYTWDQSLRVTGGSEKTQFNIGVGYRTNNTVERNNNYTRRISLNGTLDHKINDYIKFGLSTQTTLRLLNTGGAGQLQQARYISPLTYPYNADGTINPLPQSDQLDGSFVNPLLPGQMPDQYYNYTRGFVNNDILYGEVTPIKHLRYRYTVNYNYAQSLQGVYNGINGADLTTVAKTTASTTNNYSYRLNQEHLLSYDNVFAQKHSVNFVAVFTNELAHTENSSISGMGIPEDANKASNLGLAQSITNVNGQYSEQGIVSWVGRLNYAFDSKYDVTATIRSDANSALAAGHQTTTYPSIGLGWVISNENFMKKYTFIDNLKLRGGYGETSAATINPYNTLGQLSSTKYQFGSVSAGDAQGVLVNSLVNPTLTWQRSAEYNLALDFAVLKGRITGSVEVYKTTTTGIILPNNLPATSGALTQTSNLGTSQDKGLEITLSSVNIQNPSGINWSTDFNIAFSREKVIALPNGGLQNISSGEFVGEPLNVIYDLKKIGIWQTSEAAQAAVYGQKPGSIKIEDVNNDGKIDANDDQIIGHFNPNYTFGMTNRFSYKNFDLNFVIQGRMGFTTIVPYVSSSNSANNGWQYLNIGRHNQPVIDYWTPTNPTNAFPEPNGYAPTSYYSTLQYYDGSFIRVKSINLGYNLPAKLVKKIGMSGLRIYANVTDPFFLYAPITKHSFSVPDAESTYSYNTTGQAITNPADPSASGNIAGSNSGLGGINFRGVGISAGEQTRDFIIGINARF